MSQLSFVSVIFDLDGVITKTALVHAAAWKAVFDECLKAREEKYGEPFREFTHEGDYLPYVDGKPRYEGVDSFLKSRGVNLPFGDPQDPPEDETVCGVGNRKNIKFLEILRTNGVEEYESTISLIKGLKEKGVRIGVASSSKNCQYVLKSAGIEELFETRVDGEVSAENGLKGKPEGDIFVTAAANLGTLPGRSVVVEDATSGVQAGRNGAFGLVLGIAREGNEKDLMDNGADIVVTDLEHVDIEWIEGWFKKYPRRFIRENDVWKEAKANDTKERDLLKINKSFSVEGMETALKGKKPVFFFDYDGTLTPIVKRPELAVISDDMKDIIAGIAEKYTVAVISGRAREVVEEFIGVEGIVYAGSHGVDINGRGVSMIQSDAEARIPVIAGLTTELTKKVGSVEGVIIEQKKFSTAVHYRLAKDEDVPAVEQAVNKIAGENDSVRVMKGKKVFEVMPDIDWNKGKAVRWIMETLGLSWDENSVIYFGDDVTDEDAFRIIRTRGTGILVSEEERISAADFVIATPNDVKTFLETAL